MPLELKTVVDGVEMLIPTEDVEVQREGLITLRDEALRHDKMDWVVHLSHTISTLSAVLKAMEE